MTGSVASYLRLVPVEAAAFVVVDSGLVAAILGEFGSVVQNLLRLQHAAGHLLHDVAHGLSQSLLDLNAHKQINSLERPKLWSAPRRGRGRFLLYLEVGADLRQQGPRRSDVIGGHELPLQDGQGDVGARGQVLGCDWWVGQLRSRWPVCFWVPLKLDNLHVGQSLQTDKRKAK